MKFLFTRIIAIVCLFMVPALLAFQLDRSDTIVYLVRHAEKDLSDPTARDPALTPAGEVRAQHLAEKLRKAGINAVYSTPFIRTVNTVTPLATQQKLTIKYYGSGTYPSMEQVLEKEQGKTILVCGHSNTLLPIIRQAGARLPIETIADSEYDNLFKLVIHTNGTAEATVEKYN